MASVAEAKSASLKMTEPAIAWVCLGVDGSC